MKFNTYILMLIVGSGIGLLGGAWWHVVIAQAAVVAVNWMERFLVSVAWERRR